MNSTALQIYSFLMRMDIQFIRYCHAAYQTRTQWLALLKKSKLEATVPVCSAIPQKTGYALYLHTEETTTPVISEDMTTACCTLLHCLPYTLSPLGLLFDTQKSCPLYVEPALYEKNNWCFSPCSNVSSVLITQKIFLEQFLPAIQHPPILENPLV